MWLKLPDGGIMDLREETPQDGSASERIVVFAAEENGIPKRVLSVHRILSTGEILPAHERYVATAISAIALIRDSD